MKAGLLTFAAGLAMSGSALAQFSFFDAGPVNSGGAVGSGDNGIIVFAYAGPSFAVGDITLQGDLTEVLGATYGSEARLRITAPGGQTWDSGPWTATNDFTGTIAVGPSTQGSFGLGTQGAGNWTFEFWESYDDGAGADSFWTNLNITVDEFQVPPPPSSFDLGTFSSVTQIETDGAYDSEIGLYDANGTLLGNDDDGGNGVGSLLNFGGGGLADGTYYLAVSGYNATFANGFAVTAGSASGQTNLLFDGVLVDTRDHAANTVDWYSFTIPAPSGMALLGLGGIAAVRRRR